MKKTIFIYGFKGYIAQSRIAKQILRTPVLCFEYNSSLTQTIEEIAKDLDKFIIKNTESKDT